MTQPLRIAIAGLGTVGAGTIRALTENADLIEGRAGRPIQVVAVCARHRDQDRGIDLSAYDWAEDARTLADRDDVDLVVELIGGSEGIAKETVERALDAGKHVVTANKALVAHHGTDLAKRAEKAGAALAYEAAVAGGIPIVKSLREGLAGNRIKRIYGILNGTCNYILTEMRDTGRDFDDVLAEAQRLGYAEADPSFDVDGIDAAHKLAILASLAFGTEVGFDAVHVEGIRHISPIDLEFARQLGYGIKLLGIASQEDGVVEQRVHPCMVDVDAPINYVEGSFNAVVAEGDFVDTVIHEGRGAGQGPTASAVVADIVDIARGRLTPTFGVSADRIAKLSTRPMSEHRGSYYVRLMVVDKPGVFADVAAILRDHEVSMESVLQRARDPGLPVPVVMTLHETRESAMIGTLEAFEAVEAIVEPPRMIRIEAF